MIEQHSHYFVGTLKNETNLDSPLLRYLYLIFIFSELQILSKPRYLGSYFRQVHFIICFIYGAYLLQLSNTCSMLYSQTPVQLCSFSFFSKCLCILFICPSLHLIYFSFVLNKWSYCLQILNIWFRASIMYGLLCLPYLITCVAGNDCIF